MTEMNINDAVAHPLAKYRNHLEFNGYQVEEEDEDLLLCRHPRKANMMLKNIPDRGVLIIIPYDCEPDINLMDLLKYANDLNANFMFIKAYIDEEKTLFLETFFDGEYDRKNFSTLLDNIESDMEVLADHDLTQEYLQ